MTLESVLDHLCSIRREQLIAHGAVIGFTTLVVLVRLAASIFRFILKITVTIIVVLLAFYVLRGAKAAELPAGPVAGSHPSQRARQEGARIFPENLSLPAISPIEVAM